MEIAPKPQKMYVLQVSEGQYFQFAGEEGVSTSGLYGAMLFDEKEDYMSGEWIEVEVLIEIKG